MPPPGIDKAQEKRLKNLIGRPFAAAPVVPLTGPAKIAALAQQIKVKQRGNPYQQNFTKFLFECVWTKDEGGGGWVRQFPQWDYFYDLEDDVLTEPRLFIEKSRRVMASWFMCAFDLWLIAGGQDPRWLTSKGEKFLMRSTENRLVVLGARKQEQFQGSSWFLHERVKFIYDQFVSRQYRETHWPEFPEITFNEVLGKATNGGQIHAVPQGADIWRGPGATLGHCEEVSFWDHLKRTIGAASPMLDGGGHMVLVSTANAASYARDLVKGEAK